MAGFRWTEAMGVGVPALDNDHKCMVRIINLLREACEGDGEAPTTQTVLDTLKLYGRFHFKREERVMETVRFPGAAFHRAEHQSFARRIEELRSRTGADRNCEAADSIYDFLTGWLRHHILIQDMAYKPYIRDREEAERIARGAAPLIPDLFQNTVDA